MAEVVYWLCQWLIMIFGPTTMFLLSCKNYWTRRWGYIIGAIHQPCWFYVVIYAKQWPVFVLTCFYTCCYLRGIYNFWRKQ